MSERLPRLPIPQLPATLVNHLAAGQGVHRPASRAKDLVEPAPGSPATPTAIHPP